MINNILRLSATSTKPIENTAKISDSCRQTPINLKLLSYDIHGKRGSRNHATYQRLFVLISTNADTSQQALSSSCREFLPRMSCLRPRGLLQREHFSFINHYSLRLPLFKLHFYKPRYWVTL